MGRNEKSIFTLIARARQLPRAHKRHSSQHLLSRGVHGIYCSTHMPQKQLEAREHGVGEGFQLPAGADED